jgi:hypothetical protein
MLIGRGLGDSLTNCQLDDSGNCLTDTQQPAPAAGGCVAWAVGNAGYNPSPFNIALEQWAQMTPDFPDLINPCQWINNPLWNIGTLLPIAGILLATMTLAKHR